MGRSGRIFLLLVLAAVVFLPLLGRRDIVTSHEARVAQTAREMAESGWPWSATPVQTPPVSLQDTPDGKRLKADWNSPDRLAVNPWGVPTLNHEIRLQKPPLPYWTVAVLYKLTDVDSAAARAPSALLGVLGTLLIFDLARRLIGRRAAWYAALAWLSTHFIVDEMCKAMADPYLAFFTLLSIWAWIAARDRNRLLLVFYISLALGFLSKGPVIVLHVAIPLALYHWLYRRPAPRSRGWTHAAGAALFLLITLPWPLYVLRHVPNALELWRYESVGEFTGENVEKARAWYFYAPAPFQLALPWIGLWIAGIVAAIGQYRAGGPTPHRRALLPLLWLLAILIVFSLSSVKKNAYLLPMMPASVLLVALAAGKLEAMTRLCKKTRLPLLLSATQAAIGAGAGIVLCFLLTTGITHLPPKSTALEILGHLTRNAAPAGLVLGLLALLVGYIPLFFRPQRRFRLWFTAQAISYALLLVLLAWYNAGRDNARSPRPAAGQITRQLLDDRQYTLSRFRIPAEMLFYLDGDYDPAAPHILVAVDARDGKDPRLDLSHWQDEPSPFAPDVPGRRITSAVRMETPANSTWEVFDLTAD